MRIFCFVLSCFIAISFVQALPSNTSLNFTADCPFTKSAGLQYVECYGKSFALMIPEQCISQQCGFVIDVHGLSMGSDIEDANTNMRELGNQYNYAILQPQASGSPPLTSWGARDDKDVYLTILEVIDLFELDQLRVHFTGFSQGGAMTWRFLKTYGGMFGSFAPIAMNGISLSDSPVRRPVIYCAGTTDGLVSWSNMLQTQKNLVQVWDLVDPQIVGKGDQYVWTRWRSNDDDLVFEFIQHDYEAAKPWRGHCFPGSKDTPDVELLPGQVAHNGCWVVGKDSPFAWGKIVMEFFVAHPLK